MHPVRIRAHHLLCLRGFQGYGYSPDFIENMTDVIKDIESSPDLLVEVVESCDAICLACPHNREDVCLREENSQDKVRDMDRQVLEKLGLKGGQRIRAGDIFPLTDARLENTDVEEICGDCDWRANCLFFGSRHQWTKH